MQSQIYVRIGLEEQSQGTRNKARKQSRQNAEDMCGRENPDGVSRHADINNGLGLPRPKGCFTKISELYLNLNQVVSAGLNTLWV